MLKVMHYIKLSYFEIYEKEKINKIYSQNSKM